MSIKTVRQSPFRSIEEANRLVEKNIGLALHFLARQMTKTDILMFMDRDDLESIIMEAFFVASRIWDPSRAKFSTCAHLVMNSEVRSHLRRVKKVATLPQTGIPARRIDRDVDDSLGVGLGVLSDIERFVIDLRFMQGHTLKEISDLVGVTKERIRQIEKRALEKARARLEAA